MVSVLSHSDYHIDVEIKMDREQPHRMTGFYEFADRGLRHQSWALLRQLATQAQLPWVLLGDFNDLQMKNMVVILTHNISVPDLKRYLRSVI